MAEERNNALSKPKEVDTPFSNRPALYPRLSVRVPGEIQYCLKTAKPFKVKRQQAAANVAILLPNLGIETDPNIVSLAEECFKNMEIGAEQRDIAIIRVNESLLHAARNDRLGDCLSNNVEEFIEIMGPHYRIGISGEFPLTVKVTFPLKLTAEVAEPTLFPKKSVSGNSQLDHPPIENMATEDNDDTATWLEQQSLSASHSSKESGRPTEMPKLSVAVKHDTETLDLQPEAMDKKSCGCCSA